MSENRLSNLIKDLSKAKQQALLIEVLQSDLESLSGQNDDALKTVCNASAKVFDVGIKSGKTNVLMVGEAQGQAPLSIFGALLNSLDEEFDDLHKREILKKLAGFGLGQALGGGVGDAVSESLSVGAEKMMDYLAEWTGSASDFIASAFEKGVETAAEQSGDLLETAGETGAEAVTGYFSSDNEMYLSRPARKRLKELAPRLSEQATSHETLQLALEMLLVSAQGAPKVIVVKDPLQLDEASLALLAMLVSVEKDLRQLNHNEEADQGRAQTAGISVVLAFTGPQPHDSVENNVTEKKLRAISRLRMMASRYNLLERLDSDIPVPAVRASTFVGREAELNSLWQDWNRICTGSGGEGVQTWALIKGEPGTGKTALANRFIQQVRSDTDNPGRLSIPILRMLNQTGHSAQATGLASLKNSLVDELRRFNLIYEENVGWFDRTGQKLKEGAETLANDARSDDPEVKKRVRTKLGRVIFKLLGVDSAIEVARSAKSWREQDEMSSLRQDEFGRSSKANQKDEQYELMRMALNEVSQMAHKCLPDADDQLAEKTRPMILLIDDLQWMDDFTAEFLMNEWPANLPVYVIATARGSDSFAAVTESRVHRGSNRHRNSLFAELCVIDTATLSPDERLETSLSLAGQVDLKGMDQPMLANLIYLTYRGITAEQSKQFSAAVISNLASEAGASDIITLFAIETLNVISDPQFYRRNAELPLLIKPEGTDRYRFFAPESTSLTQALGEVFKKLTDTYQASYLIDSEQGTRGAGFNLASYAILEERLHLIEQHFGDYGGAARYSLLFSALLGSPFESGLVRHVLDDLQQLSPQEHPEMAPFLKELQAKAQGGLEPAQYEILERAYEIIRRLEENTGKYAHQHSLLRQFLLGQFTYLLNRVYPSAEKLERGVVQLVEQVATLGDQWFDLLEKSASEDAGSGANLDKERNSFFVNLTGFSYEYLKELGSNNAESALNFAICLNNYGLNLNDNLNVNKAMLTLQKALEITQEGCGSSLDVWVEVTCSILGNLANTHSRLGDFERAVDVLRNKLSLSKEKYKCKSEKWKYNYTFSLAQLAQKLLEISELEESAALAEEALSLTASGYEVCPKTWEVLYLDILDLSAYLAKARKMELLANLYWEKACAVCEKGLQSKFAKSHFLPRALRGMARVHSSFKRYSQALQLQKRALNISRENYESAPRIYSKAYATDLYAVAVVHDLLGNMKEAADFCLQSLKICRDHYEESPAYWTKRYSDNLDFLILFYKTQGLKEQVLEFSREAFNLYFDRHGGSHEFSFEYAIRKANLSVAYYRCGDNKEALRLREEVLSSCRAEFAKMPDKWAEAYEACLGEYLDYFWCENNSSEFSILENERMELLRKLYYVLPRKGALKLESSLLTKARKAGNLRDSVLFYEDYRYLYLLLF